MSFIRFQNRRVKYKKEVIIEKSPQASNSSSSSSCKCLCSFNQTKNVIQAKSDKHDIGDCDEAIVCSSTGSHIMANNGINNYGCDQRMWCDLLEPTICLFSMDY